MRYLCLLLLLLITIFPKATYAHTVGQPPFFKINNVYADLYSVPTTSIADLVLPQDNAPDKYLVNNPIDFALDMTRIGASPEQINRTKFSWDFGDGTTGLGLQLQHSYHQIGSYVLSITADDGTTPQPQMIESAIVNIMPNSLATLPKVAMLVNDQKHSDSLNNVVYADLSQPVRFSADSTDIKNGISTITWDFGDTKSSHDLTTSHQFDSNLHQVNVVLRIKDKNNYINDYYIDLENHIGDAPPAVQNNTSTPVSIKHDQNWPVWLVSMLLLAIVIGIFFKKSRSKRR